MILKHRIFSLYAFILFIAGLLFSTSAFANDDISVPALSGKPLLTISGQIEHSNAENKSLQLDLAMLEAFPSVEIKTMTPWDEDEQSFEGARLKDVLMYAKAKTGSELTVTGLDDYYAVMPWEDIENYDVIIAYKHNGDYIKRRDLGPLRIIYPFTAEPETDQLEYHARAVWQLLDIVVE